MMKIPKRIGHNIIVYVFLSLCFLCFSQYLGIRALNLLIVAVIIATACCANVDDLFVVMYATLPLYNLISYRAGSYSMHYIIIGIFIIKYFLHNKISLYKIMTFLILFTLRVFAADFVLLISWSLLILPLILTFDDAIWQRNFKRVVFWMNLTMLLSCIAGYIMMVTEKSIYTTAYLYISGVRTVRFAGVTGDSIVFGQTCVLIISLNLICCFFKTNHKKFYIVSTILLAIASLLSFSKMTLLCMCFVLIAFCILYAKEYVKDRKRLLKAFIFSGVIVAIVLALFIIIPNYSGNSAVLLGYIDRFTRDDLSTGRFSLWGTYLKMTVSKLHYLFVPLTSQEISTPIWNPSTGGYVSYVHNLYLETIAVFGWCAAITIFVWLFHRLYKYIALKNKIILMLPILVLLFMGIGSHGNMEYQFYLQLAIALACLQPAISKVLYKDSVRSIANAKS